jgi:type IV pilus assembly protein PilC
MRRHQAQGMHMASTDKQTRKDAIFAWEGKDKSGKLVRGEMRAMTQTVVRTTLRRQGILPVKIKKQSFKGGGTRSPKRTSRFSRASWRR